MTSRCEASKTVSDALLGPKPIAKAAKKRTAIPAIKETDLYGPVKAHFETQGYQVKGEVGAADMVALLPCADPLAKDAPDPIIIELKTGFTLSLFHQAINRQSMTDQVYIAVPRKTGKAALVAIRRNKMLCRRLGIGLITVRLSDGAITVHCDPAPFTPRKIKARKTKLISEFENRHGDPNTGGMTSSGMMTSYRQGALRCAKVLHDEGACKAAYVAKMAGFEKARNCMASNHYGWFEKIDRGVYGLTPKGAKALEGFADEVASMM